MNNDLGNDGGGQRRTTAGDDMGDDVGNDVGDGDDGGDNASNNAGKGDGRDTVGEGEGAPGRGHGSGGSSSVDGGSGGCILQGSLLFIVKVFLCGIFMMCGGNWQGHTSSHTLVMLEALSIYAEKKLRSWKNIGLSRPFFWQKLQTLVLLSTVFVQEKVLCGQSKNIRHKNFGPLPYSTPRGAQYGTVG